MTDNAFVQIHVVLVADMGSYRLCGLPLHRYHSKLTHRFPLIIHKTSLLILYLCSLPYTCTSDNKVCSSSYLS